MSPSITRADAQLLGRRALQPTRQPGELLAVFVSGKLVNTKNARLHYMAESRYKRGWRDSVALAILESEWRPMTTKTARLVWAMTPKRVVFKANTYAAIDSDGLQVALAPVRDALITCGVIHDDNRDCGHEFIYQPCVIDRANRGVEIRVRVRDA